MVLGVVMDRGVVVVVVVVVVARGDIAAYFAARFRLVLVLMWRLRLVLRLVLRTFSVLLRTSMTSLDLGLGLGAWIVILCLCILSYLEDLSISWLSVQLFAAWSDSLKLGIILFFGLWNEYDTRST